jgi:enoyl-CoA hydratase
MRIASEAANLGQPEVKLGLVPGWGGTQRLPRLVGRSAALRMLLTGEPVGAEEALRIGLVDEVIPAGELMARGTALATMIADGAPLAVKACIEAVEQGFGAKLEDGLRVEAEVFGRLSGTEDKREGVAAFLEKRTAIWMGR